MGSIENKMNQFGGLFIAVVALLVYANSLGNGFVWDDDVVIVGNSALRGTAVSLFSDIDSGREMELTPYYRPITLLTFLIEERLHGLAPFPMHLLNVLLHAINTFLVFRLARSLIKDNYAALVAGLLFAVHPINTESVDFISGGRNTLLACLLVLSAYALHRRSIFKQSYAGAVVGSLFFLAALFSKETAVGILPFILLLEFSSARAGALEARFRSYGRLLPYAVCILSYFILRGRALSEAGVQSAIFPGLGTRLLDNLYIIPRYFLTIIWPPSLSPRYFIPDDINLLALPLALAWLLIIGAAGWLFTRGRSPASVFGILWFIVFFFPVSGIIPFPSAPLADRYLYLPAIGLWLVIADKVAPVLRTDAGRRRNGLIVISLILLSLATLTAVRNLDWNNGVTLFSPLVKQYPDKAFGHHNLGCAYLDQIGDLNAAEREFNKTAALDPYFPRLRTQMGYLHLLRGDYEGAIRQYDEAIAQNPFDAEALLNRAIALDKLGRYEDAVANYKRFLATPSNELPHALPQAEERVRALSQ